MRVFLLALSVVAIGNVAIAEMRIERDIVYAKYEGTETLRTSLDLYAPEEGTGHPVMVWIHGGAWRIGDKRAVQEKPRAFVEKGFVFVSINYRLNSNASYKEQGADVAKAIRWVHDHAEMYGGDSDRIFVMGHSAGAHLAALVATDNRYLRNEKLKLNAVKGVILLDGAGYDIPKQVRWALGRAKKLYTTVFTEDEKTQRDASPITHVAKGKGIPPFLIVHVADRLASKMQSKLLAESLQKADVKASVFPAENKTHATVNRELGLADDPATKQVFAFLDGILAGGSSASKQNPTGHSVERTVAVDGLTRKYTLFVPSERQSPLPLVFALHGGGSNARQIERSTRFNALAEKEGFMVCYPQAVEKNWNDGRGVDFIREQRENIDDVKFIRTLVKEIGKDYRLDRSRVFTTGASNGAIMSHRLAAEASDVIAAVAPVIGGMAPDIAKDFRPKHPVSLFVIQGNADPLVPIDGGSVGFKRGRKRGRVISTKEVVAKYVERNGITGKPTVAMLKDNSPNDSTTTEATVYPTGVGGIKVQVYVVQNGGHTWPGRPLYLPERVIGKASRDFDATKAIWDFFKSCPSRRLAE